MRAFVIERECTTVSDFPRDIHHEPTHCHGATWRGSPRFTENNRVYWGGAVLYRIDTATERPVTSHLLSREADAHPGKYVVASDIGRVLDVAGLVEGTVRREGGRVRITAQLTSARDGKVQWSDSFERASGDVFAMQDELTTAIVAAVTPTRTISTCAAGISGRAAAGIILCAPPATFATPLPSTRVSRPPGPDSR
jgi:hypothetical protein